MSTVVAALAGGCVLGLVVVAAFGVAFVFGVGPVEHLIDRDPIHPF